MVIYERLVCGTISNISFITSGDFGNVTKAEMEVYERVLILLQCARKMGQ